MKKVLMAAFMLLTGSLYAQVATNYEIGTWSQFKTATVSYTMDDNCSNQLPVALPLFDKYNFKVTFFTVINWSPNWSGLLTASKNGHEVGSHTMTHPTSLATLSIAAQNTELQQSQTTINANITNAKCVTLAYPNCNRSDLATTQKYYIAGRVCSGTVELQTPADFYNISSIITGNTGSVQTAANLNSKVAAAKSSKGWCVFLTHGIDNDGGYSPTQSTELASHLSYMNTNSADFWVAPFGTVVKYIKERNVSSVTETVITNDSLKVVVADNLDNTIYNVPITIRRLLPTGWQNPKVYLNSTLITSSLSTVSGKTYIVFDAVPNQGNIFLANKSTAVSPAAPTVTTPVVYCQNATATALTATGTALKWYTAATGGTSLTSITPVTTATGTINYYVSQTVSGCEGPRALIAVTINALPSATISATTPTTFCAGASVTLSTNTTTGLAYTWYNAAVPIPGATTATYNATTSGSYTVTVYTINNKCSATSTPTVVTVNALPTAAITAGGATTFCTGGSVTLTSSTGTSYQWNNAAGPISGATSSTYAATTAGSYTVKVTNANTCSATSTATVVTVNALPTATITAGGATTFCTGGSVTLTSSTGTSYQWNNAAGPISGATSATYAATTAGSYTVKVTNANTCSATSTATTVTVNALPTAAITASGSTTFCTGGSVTLTSSTGTLYQWNNAAGPISGATSATYAAATAGSYTVKVTNANTCSATSTAIAVTVNALPTATITAGGATTFCTGGSVTLTSSTGTSYQWNNAAGPISGATSATYAAATAGSYTVKVTNANTCSATSTATVVTVNALPTATITAGGATAFCTGGSVTLTSSTGTSYQWNNAAGPISGATNATYAATTADSYTVKVTNANTCSATSIATTVTVSSAITWYQDVDGDGKGDAAVTQTSCTQPTGYVSISGDACPTDANKLTPGSCGCGNLETDTDGDLTADCIDTDDDGDGIPDATDCAPLDATIGAATVWYQDVDGDGKGNAAVTQTSCTQPTGYVSVSGDACPTDPNKIDPGVCGCGSPETDTDGDTIPDCTDTDDDNDGIPDVSDCAPLDASIGAGTVWYQDEDGDSEGDASSTLTACSQPSGYVSVSGDGCPNDADKTAPGICGCGKAEGSCTTTGIQNALSTALQIYPNPSETDFTIVVGSGDFTVTFYNASGLEVLKGEYSSEVRIGSVLPSGMYLIRIEQQGMTETRKIIKK